MLKSSTKRERPPTAQIHRAVRCGLFLLLFCLMPRQAYARRPIANQTASPTAGNCSSIANGTCTQTRSGLSLCRLNNVCVVKVDLTVNTLRPKVVIAAGGGVQYVSTMAANAGALAAINGDYFSGCPDTSPPLNCGQGITYIDGVDYTRYEFDNWQNRRSLGFNDSNNPNLGMPTEQGGYHRMLLAGGPKVTWNGEFRWRCWYSGSNTEGNCECRNNSTVVINDELFGCSANNWWNRPQTFVGVSDDGNTLYLAASEPGYSKTIHEMHDVLWVHGAHNTLKMDGGGSSSMYFNDGGYSFSWNGDPRQVANAWVIVPYTPPTCYSLNTQVNPNGAGNIDISPGPNCNGNQYNPGTNVQLTANASSGYSFSSWSGDAGGSSNPTTVTMNSNRSVSANFTQNPICYTLTTNSSPTNSGSTSANPQPNCSGDKYTAGTAVALTANPVSGFTFTNWSGAASGSANPLNLTVNGDTSLTANFQALASNYWRGEYYNNTTLSGSPTLVRDDFSLDFDWGIGSADLSLPGDFSARWSRTLDFPTGTYRFHVRHDDGVRIYIDGILRLDEWESCCRWDMVDMPLSAAAHTIQVEWFDSGGAANVTLYWERLDISGWRAEYFNNDALANYPILVRNDTEINFDWLGNSPDPLVVSDHFSARWSQTMTFPGGPVTFFLWHDDGVRLYVDNGLVNQNWCDNCRQTDQVAVHLSPGPHLIRVEMFENVGWSGIHLWWDASTRTFLPIISR